MLGAHMSIAGGLDRALRRGRDAGCDAIQLFTATARGWSEKVVTDEEVERFESARRETGIERVIVHAGYLVNLASPLSRTWKGSIESLARELRRAERIRATDLVLHPGAHVGCGEASGLARVARGLREVLRRVGPSRCRIALELTAGQGSSLGHRFEHLGIILDRVRRPERFSVCFDTCHALAAGYDIRTPEGLSDALAAFDRIIGLDRLAVFHLNDSVKGLGSRVDRHTHIGRGEVGAACFRALVRDPRFRDVPMILETPKEPPEDGRPPRMLHRRSRRGDADEHALDRMNLAVLRALRAGRRPPPMTSCVIARCR